MKNTALTTTECTELKALAQIINASYKRTEDALMAAIECGEALVKAKEMVKHGEWEDWLEANCRVSIRTAQRYMNLVETDRLTLLEGAKSKQKAYIYIGLENAEKRKPRAPKPATVTLEAEVVTAPVPLEPKQLPPPPAPTEPEPTRFKPMTKAQFKAQAAALAAAEAGPRGGLAAEKMRDEAMDKINGMVNRVDVIKMFDDVEAALARAVAYRNSAWTLREIQQKNREAFAAIP
jgi:hypothetical protein